MPAPPSRCRWTKLSPTGADYHRICLYIRPGGQVAGLNLKQGCPGLAGRPNTTSKANTPNEVTRQIRGPADR
jgi:hypothetical protein